MRKGAHVETASSDTQSSPSSTSITCLVTHRRGHTIVPNSSLVMVWPAAVLRDLFWGDMNSPDTLLLIAQFPPPLLTRTTAWVWVPPLRIVSWKPSRCKGLSVSVILVYEGFFFFFFWGGSVCITQVYLNFLWSPDNTQTYNPTSAFRVLDICSHVLLCLFPVLEKAMFSSDFWIYCY